MKITKKITAIILALVVIMAATVGCSDGKRFFNITTGGTGGTYYPVGGALAEVLSNNVENLAATAQAGNASVANCNLILNHETESAFVQNNVAYWAYEGIGSFEGKKVENVRGVASLYPEAIQLVALKDSGINSVEDLKGKKVSVGEQGSGVDFDVQNIFNAHGLTYEDVQIDYLSFSEAAQKIKDKQIDAAFVTAGYPTSSIIDISLAREINIVPIAEEKIDKMIEKSPYYAKAVIPAGTYQGQDADIVTATTMAMWVVDEQVDEALVYDVTKALWENRDSLEAAHEKGKSVTIDTALDGMAIPLHPGAEKYYKEQGLIK
ncbi:hypothetical protein SAMN02745945_01926 [Peptoclostridium litorale DSM 5388]|uniref:31 kDa immunogenic protein n=1 Tax=Peptoclostridium litorale DSM 5388 TaxID=1121324 RepID=A0A069RGR6_PEPLI|nr:TAXI family TRAP transporter solute-binding subunit [Peptoclostridium litorale]KDR96196.1 31 kDa immunogenic protein [Peptoclostridium litorale DSM 5388]SIO13375.1 hypothetical protein SAMN02745945_01926 [Peptoclostridium litorale DSM 5388]